MPIPVIVMDEYREVLTRLGLTTIEGAKDYRGELVKDHHGRRDILRIQQPNGPVLYLKRNWRPYKKDGLWSLLRHGCAWSQSRQEWENMLALQRAGLHTAGLVAYGQARSDAPSVPHASGCIAPTTTPKPPPPLAGLTTKGFGSGSITRGSKLGSVS